MDILAEMRYNADVVHQYHLSKVLVYFPTSVAKAREHPISPTF